MSRVQGPGSGVQITGIKLKISYIFLAILLVAVFSSISEARYENAIDPKMERALLEGNYNKIVSDATKLIDSRSSGREELYYERGLAELKLGKFDAARSDFNTVISKYSRSGRKFDSYIGIGDAYFLEGNIGNATKSYEGILSEFPNDKNLALVYYRIGCCYRKSGINDRAEFYFDKSRKMAPLSFESRMIPRPGYCRVATAEAEPNHDTQSLKEPLSGQGSRFSVQVGSFKSKYNAEKLSHKLTGDGYETFVDYAKAAEDGMYRVKVGRFSWKNEAEKTASDLKGRGYNARICSGDACQ
jgi:tetratricopeptide (TPR) repeat protein